MASAAEDVIQRFGGISKMADAMGHKYVTTVAAWKKRRLIPAHQHAAVMAAALKAGINLTLGDLHETNPPIRKAPARKQVA